MDGPVRIALLMGRSFGYSRNVLRGIKTYATATSNWICRQAEPLLTPMEMVAQWDPDGIIAHLGTAELANTVMALRKPVVNVSGVMDGLPLPRVMLDHEAVGRMGARYFMERGFRHFAFLGFRGHSYSAMREMAFREALREAGLDTAAYEEVPNTAERRSAMNWPTIDDRIRRWIESLPKPTALMACNDLQAAQAIEAARESGLRIPEDLAVLGVDNDQLLCELMQPPMSSIAVPAQRVGYEAAALLDRILQGQPAPAEPLILEPVGVVTRHSSDTLAIDDADLAAAVRFIRSHADEAIGVEEVLGEIPISRRSLERRFRQVLGRSPLEEIRRAHMERAKELLSTTDLSMPEVAKRSGFPNAERFSVVFHQEAGMTPTSYRRQFRLHE